MPWRWPGRSETWLAENLRETEFSNGDFIPFHGEDNNYYFTDAEWSALITAGCAAYDNDVDNVSCGFVFPTVEYLYTSGSWVVPTGVSHVVVELWGSGGAGGAGGIGTQGGGGGGAAAYVRVTPPSESVVAGNVYPYTISTGATSTGGNGGDAGDTEFNFNGLTLPAWYAKVNGGEGGNDYDNGGAGGAAGTVVTYNSNVKASHDGADGVSGTSTYSGGGSGGAGSTGNAKSATTSTGGGLTTDYGGAGGNGSASSNGNGTAGSNYGSGGGGATGSGTAGNGANGLIRITYK